MPLALAIIAGITFVLLFLLFGSVVIPLKALVLNVLSLSATFGAMVWIFQDGNLSGAPRLHRHRHHRRQHADPHVLRRLRPLDGLRGLPAVADQGGARQRRRRPPGSVALGLERTGRIVTAAALLIAVVFLAFGTSQVTFIKLFGLGLALAVLTDAFLIRGTLVPAFMRLAGGANWWAPEPLRRLHDRFGVSEHVDLDPPAVDPAANGRNGTVPVVLVEDAPTRPRRSRPLVAAGRTAPWERDG